MIHSELVTSSAGAFYSPPDLPMHFPAAEALITLAAAAAAVVAFAVAFRLWRTSRSAVPVFLLIGAGIATINEPLVDLLGKCYHNGNAQWRLFELFERPIPAWGLFGYIIVYGVTAWCILAAMQHGAGRTQLWIVVGAMCLVQVAMEMVILPTNLYYYYDYQPWSFFGMPLHWLAINFSGTVLTASVLAFASPYLTGRRQALVVLLPMTTQIVGSYFVGFPVFAVLHSSQQAVGQWIGGAVTIILAIIVIDLAGLLVRKHLASEARLDDAMSASA